MSNSKLLARSARKVYKRGQDKIKTKRRFGEVIRREMKVHN
jgi:hypothetical protein